jgi:hypothetical protein
MAEQAKPEQAKSVDVGQCLNIPDAKQLCECMHVREIEHEKQITNKQQQQIEMAFREFKLDCNVIKFYLEEPIVKHHVDALRAKGYGVVEKVVNSEGYDELEKIVDRSCIGSRRKYEITICFNSNDSKNRRQSSYVYIDRGNSLESAFDDFFGNHMWR